MPPGLEAVADSHRAHQSLSFPHVFSGHPLLKAKMDARLSRRDAFGKAFPVGAGWA